MKKIVFVILWVLVWMMSFSFAQSSALTQLYTLLDSVITKNPQTAQVVLETLDTYEQKILDEKRLRLITQIRTFVQSKYAQATLPKIPAGRKSIPLQDVEEILKIVHTKWSEDAPYLLMEFLDFQCPYCKRQHDDNILDELREVEFPEKLRTAAVMFPLTGKRHELAQQAAQSAECAYVQWWNDVFYAHKSGLYAAWLQPTMNIIRSVAQNNWLDPVRMQACIDESITAQAVQQQKNIGLSLWVSGTPWSVVMDTRSGAYKTIRGAVPIDVFMDTILKLD